MSVVPSFISPHAPSRVYRLSNQQFQQMLQPGILPTNVSIDMMDGVLVLKDPSAPFDDFYRLTVPQYHRMIDAEILTSEDPVELIQGLLVQKMSKDAPHRIALARAVRALSSALPEGWSVQSQDPITLADSEPEPDACIIRGQAEDYPTGHPTAADVPLVIEVADTTLRFDRSAKQAVYAAANIPTYWIINLVARTVEVYSHPVVTPDPADSFYRDIATLSLSDTLSLQLPAQLPLRFEVRAILPE